MLRKVKIITPPKKANGGKPRVNPAMGFNANTLNWPAMPGQMSNKPISVKDTVGPMDRPNVEAEKGETVITDFAKGGIPQHYTIGGKRHSKGGTPLRLSPDSFIFSDTGAMKIADDEVLAMFNKKTKGKGLTPAEIAKQYDINSYYATLMNPNSDDLQIKTAEEMIANFNLKLGKLGLIQEAMKGFKDGIPAISQPYLTTIGLDPNDFVPKTPPSQQGEQMEAQPEQPDGDMARYGKEIKGNLPKAQLGLPGGLFSGRKKPAGYRLNKKTGMVEVINNRGEVIGYAVSGGGNANVGFYGNNYGFPFGTGGGGSSTTTTTTTKKVKKQNIPSDAIIISKADPDFETKRDAAFAKSPGKVYIQDDAGKYYKVKKQPLFEEGDTEGQLNYLKEQFSDPKVAKLFREKMKEAAKDSKKLRSNDKFDRKSVLDLVNDDSITDQAFVDQFLDFNKRNRKIRTLIKDSYACYDNATGVWIGGKGCNEEIGKKYPSLENAAKEAGVPMPDKNTQALQQLSYVAYDDLLKDRDANKITDTDVKDRLKNFKIKQFGVTDEDIGGGPKTSKISQADAVYTNTTAGQVAGIVGEKFGEDNVDETEEDQTVTDTNTQGDYSGYGMARMPRKEIFAQDAIQMLGAFGDLMRAKKYPGWRAVPDFEQRKARYYSPERELAANAEQSNIAQNVLAMFAGPKLYSSRASQIQGQGAKNAADILGRYNNLNVGIANELERDNFAARNRYNEVKAQIATQNHEDNALLNQQFDNSMTAFRKNLRDSFINTITNASMAYNLNQLYPQFNISPRTGGDMFFTGGKKFKPSYDSQSDLASKFNTMKSKLPGVSDEVIWKMVQKDSGINSDTGFDAEGVAALQGLMSNLG